MQNNFSTKARCRSAAYKAASSSSSGVLQSLQVLRDFWKEEGVSPIDNRGDTILHFLAVNGNVAGFEILEPNLSVQDLETRNNSGDTPLHEAARFGKKDMVERILRIEKDLVYVQNNLGETPLYVAAASGEKDVFTILANCDFNKLTMKRNDGKTVLHATVFHDCYELAIYIVNMYPELVNDRDNDRMTALDMLSTKRLSFRSGSNYLFAEIGKTPSVPVQMIETIIYSSGISPRYKESKLSDNQTQAGTKVVCVERLPFTKSLLGNSWLQAIDEAKQKHILALILAKVLLEKYDWSYSITDHIVPNPLIQASKHKIDELVVEILQKYPELVETLDEKKKNILHIAAEHKNRFLFDYLLKKVASQNRMLADIDENGNTILHYAAHVGTPFFTSTTEHIESVWCVMSVLMMMWGVLWFKYIKYNMHPRLWDVKNLKGFKAEEMFEKNHLHVRKEAETAVRNLSNSTLVLSTLLCTINFAAIFTVPGGFEEKTGLPILLDKVQQELWMLMFYLGAALFSSVFTMGTLLSFLLCKFYSSDFYISLPIKIIIAIISIFYATAFTIVACLQALNLENIFLNKDVWWLIIAVVAVGFIMTLIYVDLTFPVFDYMYYLVYYSFFVSYKRGRM
ncbi:protein ACCELERATED CELL DEATH 6-like isoform X1 [Solanum lycopersicum]|uniref:protein ACCELERATED CELL DEATH 6-like isoform X1 n=1 Tax=Solanum lycopersicum TaxID=4081 RepID=UPI00374961CC